LFFAFASALHCSSKRHISRRPRAATCSTVPSVELKEKREDSLMLHENDGKMWGGRGN
jgi:hypothetical protein